MRPASAVDVERDRPDACPGALTVHDAADGGLARVRLPGGFAAAAQLVALADAAQRWGNGVIELTSRGNVQLRGLAEGAEVRLAESLAAAGLLPSVTHERVRNIVASPLAGLDAGVDLEPMVARLDRALCARPELADLPGRFLFAVDDGRGDVASLGADVTAVVRDGVSRVEGAVVDDVVPTMLRVAQAFLDERGDRQSTAWRVDELGRAAVLARAGLASAAARPGTPAVPAPAGVVAQSDGRAALVVLAPLGRLDPAQLRAVAAHVHGRPARVTPWRSIVVPDLDDAASVATGLSAAGLGVSSDSRWFGVSACTGTPGCARALADVQADAAAAAERWPGRVVHWSGCERRCGRPVDTAIDVVATPAGYAVSGA